MFGIAKFRAHLGALTNFSLLGFISFLIGLASLYVVYDLWGVPYWLAVPISVLVHLAIHYWSTRSLVFTESQRPVEEGFLIFVLIGVAEIIFITGSVTLIVEYLHGNVYWTRIIMGTIAAIGGFWANARYNFRVL
jgi:putative flippase GtrA